MISLYIYCPFLAITLNIRTLCYDKMYMFKHFKVSYLFILILLSACKNSLELKKSSVKNFPKKLDRLISLDSNGVNFLASNISSYVYSIADDDKGNLYVFGRFEGTTVSGHSAIAGESDLFLIKINRDLEILWEIIFNDDLAQINDSSGLEIPTNLIVDKTSGDLYFAGYTTGAFIEPNTSGNYDLLAASVSSAGDLRWIKHLGETTQDAQKIALGNATLDWSEHEFVGNIGLSDNKKLFMTYQTKGNMFENNLSFGDEDVGVINLNTSDGSIVKALQLGQQSSAFVSGSFSGREQCSARPFSFDGTKLIAACQTRGEITDTNPTGSDDLFFFIVDEDLTLLTVEQVGVSTYNTWKATSSFTTGDTSGGDQLRAVTVLGANDYLFHGKTTSDLADNALGTDIFYMRYTNGSLSTIKQMGSSNLPDATGNEQPRYLIQDSSGSIYSFFHSDASMLNAGSSGQHRPFVLKLDQTGSIKKSYVFSDQDFIDNDISPTERGLGISSSSVFSNGQLIAAINIGLSAATIPYIWTIDL